jgi:hypothetical protein
MHYVYLHLYIVLCIINYLYIFLFLAFDQLAMSIYLCTHFFLHFIDQLDLPHHKCQVSTLAMRHSLLMWPFDDSLFQLLYEIFF